jgi:hypothetical protein
MKYASMRFFARLVLCVSVFLCASPVHAASGLSISEIMFDPAGSDSGREWVEVYNGGSVDIDLAGHVLLTDGLSSSKHSLVAQGTSVIAAGSYGVIVQDVAAFKADYPNYAGVLFDSSWTGLTASSGKTIVVIDSQSAVLDSVAYDPSIGGANTGESLQKNASGAWNAAAPTPGSGAFSGSAQTENTGTPATASSETPAATSTASSGTSSVVSVASKQPTLSRMRVELSVPSRAVVGVPVTMSVKVYGYSDELRTFGGTHFAFGDGGARDGAASETVQYIYEHPGTYLVVLEYRANPFYRHDADVMARSTIEVSASSVSIGKRFSDGSLEITNTSDREADISGWIVAPASDPYASTVFHIPSGTVVLSGKKILLSHKMTKFTVADAEKAELMLPSGAPSAVPDIPEASPPQVVLAESRTVAYAAQDVTSQITASPASVVEVVTAAPSSSVPAQRSRSIAPFIIGLLGLVAAGAIAVYKFGMFAKVPTEISAELLEKPETKEAREEIRILEE